MPTTVDPQELKRRYQDLGRQLATKQGELKGLEQERAAAEAALKDEGVLSVGDAESEATRLEGEAARLEQQAAALLQQAQDILDGKVDASADTTPAPSQVEDDEDEL